MPRTLRYLDAVELLAGTDTEASHLCEARFINSRLPIMHRPSRIHVRQLLVEHPVQTTLYADDRLRRLQMPVNGNMRPHFKRVQHSLRRIVRSRPQVVVHAQPFILPCLPVQHRQQVIVNQFNLIHHFTLLTSHSFLVRSQNGLKRLCIVHAPLTATNGSKTRDILC